MRYCMQLGVLAVRSCCLRSPRLGNGTGSGFTDAWLLSGAVSSDGFESSQALPQAIAHIAQDGVTCEVAPGVIH